MSDFICPFCLQTFSSDLKVLHILPCYRAYMFKNKTAPYCTCNRCEGAKTHPGDNADGSFEREDPDAPIQHRKHELPPALPELPKKVKQELSPVLSVTTAEPNNAIHLYQRTGGSCLVCDIKKSPSAVHIPFIYLRRFSEFMICKKQHLLEEADYLKLGKLLNSAWDQIIKKNLMNPILPSGIPTMKFQLQFNTPVSDIKQWMDQLCVEENVW